LSLLRTDTPLLQQFTIYSEISSLHYIYLWHYLHDPNARVVNLNPKFRLQTGAGAEFSCLGMQKNPN
jgi:hypothetical protein